MKILILVLTVFFSNFTMACEKVSPNELKTFLGSVSNWKQVRKNGSEKDKGYSLAIDFTNIGDTVIFFDGKPVEGRLESVCKDSAGIYIVNTSKGQGKLTKVVGTDKIIMSAPPFSQYYIPDNSKRSQLGDEEEDSFRTAEIIEDNTSPLTSI